MTRSSKPSRGRRSKDGSRSSPAAISTPGPATSNRESPVEPFPIVGIGASAGGLEAFREFLEALPLETGMGFVLIQHLDPDHRSQLTRILSRSTALPVRQIVDNEPIRPNHVYVIPPDHNLRLDDRILKVEQSARSQKPVRIIDQFFESLAHDCRELAIGIILSGTASDGTLGMEAIKATGGITFAQDDSAKYDSMPNSAVAAGCVDFVLSPAQIARELARIAQHPYRASRQRFGAHSDCSNAGGASTDVDGRDPEIDPETDGDQASYKAILLLLKNHSGVDFSRYKSTTIRRRINRRIVLTKQPTIDAYTQFCRDNPEELNALYSDVLIGVTAFFRNPDTFEFLQHKILPQLFKHHRDDPLRCWVLGCSTGQEAYSIAMVFMEATENAPRPHRLQIFATDLNDTLLDRARYGFYAESLVEDVSPQRLRKFFTPQDGGYRLNKEVREMVMFARQSLFSDPPFSRIDLISCRNVLIYLDQSLQKNAIPTFHYALRPGGFLLLGASETIGTFTDLFEPVDKKHKLYAKKAAPTPVLQLSPKQYRSAESPAARRLLGMVAGGLDRPDGIGRELDPQREADRITIHRYAPPGVLVNNDFQVLQFRGTTDAFLAPPIGKASFDILKMARAGLMLPLRSVLAQAKKTNDVARKANVRLTRNGKVRRVTLEAVPLKQRRERCFLVLFHDSKTASGAAAVSEPANAVKSRFKRRDDSNQIVELEAELSAMREYVQSMQEQYEAAHEEVQAAHEEVQSTNEELQSINEELETSKEELESANEELITVNEEMSNRNEELNRLNNDLINLQASSKLAIVLFGRDLVIRGFSPHAAKQFDLIASDMGKPLGHIQHGLVEVERAFQADSDPQTSGYLQGETRLDLKRLVAQVIADVREQEREVRDKSGRWHLLRVRPYLTREAEVDGAVLVLVDVDQLKASEQASCQLAAIVESSEDAILSKSLGGIITSWNRGAERLFGYSAAEAIGHHISLIVPPERQSQENEVIARLRRGEKIAPFETERQSKDGRYISVALTASPIREPSGQIVGASTAARDITDRKRSEDALRDSEERYRELVEQVRDFAIFRIDGEGRATTWNAGVKRVLGFDRDEFIGVDISNTIFTQEDAERGVPQQELAEAAKTGTASNDRWMRRKDGSRFFANGITTALRERGGEIAGFAKVMHDQTKKLQAEEALRRSEEQLRRYSTELSREAARKNEFLAMLGHELRNPLAALAHGLELSMMLPEPNERRRTLTEMMTRQVVRISKLLEQLLDISRVISGKVELSEELVDLADVVRSAIETVMPLLEAQKHKLTVALPVKQPGAVVKGDIVRLTQVVENLLTNAAKYTNDGGQIDIRIDEDSDKFHIVVRDSGIGMKADLLPHIFEVFTQAPRALDRAKGGLGLGLPLAQRLVEMHGGRVTATSDGLGHGSEFVVTLPRAVAEELAGSADTSDSLAELEKFQRRRILVVDDEEDARTALAELLQEHGLSVVAVGDGPAAIAASRSFDPDVVLLDLGLPEMDGYEVARRLREQHRGEKHILIAVTGYQNDTTRLREAGFDGHLMKPPRLHKLAELLSELKA